MSVSQILTPFAGLGSSAIQCTGVSMYGDGTQDQAVSCQARLSNNGTASTLLASQHAVPANDCTITLNPFVPHIESAIGGVVKLSVQSAAIVASVPILMGSVVQAAQATLGGGGSLAVALPAITANAIVMVSYRGAAAGVLPLAVELQAGVGFTVHGDAGATFSYFIADY